MDGQTREGEAFGLKPNQAVRDGREARTGEHRERANQSCATIEDAVIKIDIYARRQGVVGCSAWLGRAAYGSRSRLVG